MEYGANVNAINIYGETALILAFRYMQQHLATREQHILETVLEIIQVLLTSGADVSQRDIDGRAPFHFVAGPEEVSILLEYGADVNVRDKWGQTPLHYAPTVLALKALIQAGAKADVHDKYRDTPLHMVAWRCLPLEAVSLLVESGASPIAQNNVRDTPVHMAAMNEHCTDTLQELLNGDGKKALGMRNILFLTPAILARGDDNKRILKAAMEDQKRSARRQQQQQTNAPGHIQLEFTRTIG
jgi:ankyrin repeat protein